MTTSDLLWDILPAFLVHEAAITWGEEVEYFWRRKLTGSSILCFLNKYTALAFQVVSLALYLPIFTDGVSRPYLPLLSYAHAPTYRGSFIHVQLGQSMTR